MASSDLRSRSSNSRTCFRNSTLSAMRRQHSRRSDWPDTERAVSYRVEIATDIAACALTVPIQDETWSGDVAVPPQLMLAIVHNGGFVALGYVDGDERPAGFVFGFLGIYDFHFRHHSHMLAIRREHRGTGLAL